MRIRRWAVSVGGPALSWAVTVAATGAVLLAMAADTGTAPRWADRRHLVDTMWHVVLGVALISMVWAWGAVVPVMALVVIFTAAAAWFVGRVLFHEPTVAATGEEQVASRTPRGSPMVLWYQAAIMATMVFMAVAMNAQSTTVTEPADTATGMNMAGMDMSGTGMPGMSMTEMDMSGIGWVQVSCLMLAVFFLAAAAAWVGEAVHRRGARATRAGVANALMAVGLAATFAQMV